MRAEHAQIKQKQQALFDENGRHRRELSVLREELSALRTSRSFRIGRTATWLPRKIRGGIRCWRDHGLLYTFKRAWHKIRKKMLSITELKQRSIDSDKYIPSAALNIHDFP